MQNKVAAIQAAEKTQIRVLTAEELAYVSGGVTVTPPPVTPPPVTTPPTDTCTHTHHHCYSHHC